VPGSGEHRFISDNTATANTILAVPGLVEDGSATRLDDIEVECA
jgi:hypothetical protein